MTPKRKALGCRGRFVYDYSEYNGSLDLAKHPSPESKWTSGSDVVKELFFFTEVYASWIMALVGIELVTHVSEPDALTKLLLFHCQKH